VTHWSSRLLARELGVSNATVARVWRDWDLQPWRVGSSSPPIRTRTRVLWVPTNGIPALLGSRSAAAIRRHGVTGNWAYLACGLPFTLVKSPPTTIQAALAARVCVPRLLFRLGFQSLGYAQ
jgi:hypothetical protein